MKAKLILVLLGVLPVIVFSQGTWKEYRKEVNTGLIKGGNIMSYFTEAKDGSIWVSNTTGSLVRFLNDEITIYDDLKKSIGSQTTIGIIASAREKTVGVWWFSDADMETGWVWFASNQGIVLWDTEKLLMVTGETDSKGRIILVDDNSGVNYVMNNTTLEKMDGDKTIKPTRDMFNFYTVFIDSHKRVWFGGSAGRLYSLENGIWKTWSDIIDTDAKNDHKTVRQIFESREGVVHIVCHGMLAQVVDDELMFDDRLTDLDYVENAFEDSKGNIWIAGTERLYRISKNEVTFFGESDGIDMVPYGGPIAEDQDGNIWVAASNTTIFTKSTGIYKLKPRGAIYKYDGSTWEKFSLGKKSLIADLMVDRDGSVWAVEALALFKYENGKFVEKWNCSAMRNLHNIFQDSKGNIWIGRGSFKGEIDKYEVKEGI